MRLGPTTIRVVAGDRAEGEQPGAGPGPLSSRFAGRQPLPGVLLRIGGAEGKPIRMAMDRVLALVGSSPECQVQLLEPGTSRYACALVRTPGGVWMVDLLSSRGVTLNGVACRRARLEDGDVLRVGGQSLRLTYEEAAIRPRHRAAAGPARPGVGPSLSAPIDLPAWAVQPPTVATQEAWELVPEIILGQIQGRDGPAPEASAPFHHALLMIVRLLGEMHRDHLEVVREEMEQIRRLNQEMGSLRARLPGPDPAAPGVARPAPALEGEGASSPVPEAPPRDRPAPQAVQALVGERLAAWEKERQSRWRKVMDLLVTPRPA
jgi:predicted component of type VI protein secretion system